MRRAFLLLFRFIILNIAALAVLAFVWMEGWIHILIEQDVTRITTIISALFFLGWVFCAYKVIRCSSQLNAVLEPVKHGPS